MRHFILPAHKSIPEHSHDWDHLMYTVSGDGYVEVEGELDPGDLETIKDALVDNVVHGANVSIEEPEALIGGPNFGKRAYDSQFVTVDAGGCAPHVVIDKSE